MNNKHKITDANEMLDVCLNLFTIYVSEAAKAAKGVSVGKVDKDAFNKMDEVVTSFKMLYINQHKSGEK